MIFLCGRKIEGMAALKIVIPLALFLMASAVPGPIFQQVQIQMLSGLERSIVIDRGREQGIREGDVAAFIVTAEESLGQRKELLGQARAMRVLPGKSAWYFLREPGSNRVEVGAWVEMIALGDALRGRTSPTLREQRRTILPREQEKYLTEKIEFQAGSRERASGIARRGRKYREVAIPLWTGDAGDPPYDGRIYSVAEWHEDREDPGVFMARPLVEAPSKEEERQFIERKKHGQVVESFVAQNNGDARDSGGPAPREKRDVAFTALDTRELDNLFELFGF